MTTMLPIDGNKLSALLKNTNLNRTKLSEDIGFNDTYLRKTISKGKINVLAAGKLYAKHKILIEDYIANDVLERYAPLRSSDSGKIIIKDDSKDWFEKIVTDEYGTLYKASNVIGFSNGYLYAVLHNNKPMSISAAIMIDALLGIRVYVFDEDTFKKTIGEFVHDALRDMLTSMLKAVSESEVIE